VLRFESPPVEEEKKVQPPPVSNPVPSMSIPKEEKIKVETEPPPAAVPFVAKVGNICENRTKFRGKFIENMAGCRGTTATSEGGRA
jgi:hypothetical protein